MGTEWREIMIGENRINEYKERATALVSEMTLEEKVFQLRHNAPAIERLGIPAYNYWNEALHGVARAGTATVFPQAIGMAASFDAELIGKVAETVSTEGRGKYNAQFKYDDHDIYKGLTFWAPNVNIFRDPRWGRGHETYGEDPYLTSRLGVSFVKGIQGDDKNYLKAAACAKHFAVHSGPESIRHSFDARCSQQDLYETYLPAFKALVQEAGVEAVMGAYNRTNGEPCCASKTLLKDILRRDWGFDGHVTSDCWAIKDINENHCVTSTPEESVALAINNGCDLNCGNIFEYLVKAVDEGLTSEDVIDEALIRVLTTRMKLGLFDDPKNNPYAGIDYTAVDTAEAKALNLKMSKESIVLLKNAEGALPLDAGEIKTIGVIGPNADSRRALVGNYEGTSSEYVTVLEGIRREAEAAGIRVFYSEGCHLYKDRKQGLGLANDRLAEVKAVCEASDVVIACMGLDADLEGEEGDTGNEYGSGDKPNLKFPGLQQVVMDTIAASGKKCILVCPSGSALYLDKEAESYNAILQGWYPGAQGGRANAEILFGKANPEGKLPLTFYNEKNSMPGFTDYSMKNRTYRYMVEEPLYPFGYGLSYSTFEEKITALKLNGKTVDRGGKLEFNKGDKVEVEVSVYNTGRMDGAATVQLYVEYGFAGAPVRQLKGFTKVKVPAGKSVNVKLPVDTASLALFDEQGVLKLNAGTYTINVGNSQPDALSVKLMGSKCDSFNITVANTVDA